MMGRIRFQRTGYEDKKTGDYICLLDRILGIDAHQRITFGAAAQILEETIMSSYKRGISVGFMPERQRMEGCGGRWRII